MQGHVLGGLELARAREHVAVGVKALRVLAHDHQVHVRGQGGHAGPAAAGTHVGVQVQALADRGRRIEPAFLRRRIFVGRDGAQDDAVGGAGRLDDARGQGRSLGFKRRQADVPLRQLEAQAEARVQRLEGGARRPRDLRADAVSGED